jgi:hypothetical protein
LELQLEAYFYLLNFEMKMYNMAIISNLPNIILKDNIILDIESKSIDIIPTDKPLLEMVVAASNTTSINLLFPAKK